MEKLQIHIDMLKETFHSMDNDLVKEAIDLDRFDIILRDHIKIKEMRDAGSFFTGLKLAEKTISLLDVKIDSNSVILDPACGAGNLLIYSTNYLPIYPSLLDTMKLWGKVLWGFDLHKSFVDAAKIRIAIIALSRGCIKDCTLDTATSLLKNIVCRDALTVVQKELRTVTHLVMNPPFTITAPPCDGFWKEGKINLAGIFLKSFIERIPNNCTLSVILPDVLRSGSRYEHLRDFISSRVKGLINIWGRFNIKTDVDVFILSGIKRASSSYDLKWHKVMPISKIISDNFDVRIGPLVAYRDPEEGELYPYLHPKNCAAWINKSLPDEFRKFSGTVIESPFLVIKRTSSPKDRFRASATLITIPGMIAVENHLVVIKPHNNSIEECKNLLKTLKSDDTNSFLNDRIRLRHLTVGVIKGIPI